MSQTASLLALDIGKVRVGVAITSGPDGFPKPLTTLTNDSELSSNIAQIVQDEGVGQIIAGLPRSLDGEETEQTRYTRSVVAELEKMLARSIAFQDEAATSLKAEDELKSRNRPYTKEDIDALSAVYILEDYLLEHSPKGEHG